MKLWKAIFIFMMIMVGITAVTPPTTLAQSQPITATVDRASLSTDETLLLTVVVSSDAGTPTQASLPPLDGFNVVGSSSASQISIINGEVSAQVTTQYRLQPNRAGDLTIPAISVNINGLIYETQPIAIQVTQGSGTPQTAPPPVEAAPAPTELSGQDVFVEAEVDNAAPYQGQQIIYTFRFYQAVNLYNQPSFEAPAFTGFWHDRQPEQVQYDIQAANRIYRVTELRSVLFPTVAGETTIRPARLIIPGGFFDRDEVLDTQPVPVDVQSLPVNAPAGFHGAVGQFAISAEVDTTETAVNEPITLRVTLSGRGNLDTLPDPVWPEIDGWRTFGSQATTNTAFQDGYLVGTRTDEQQMVPTTAGAFTLPPISYVYFDPETATYQTIATEPIAVNVVPGATEPPVPAVVGSGGETVSQLATDIRHIQPVPAVLGTAVAPWTARPTYWLLWLLPPLLLAGQIVWQRRRHYQVAHGDILRSQQARKKARQALAQAQKNHADPYAACSQTLTTYIADKLNQPVAGLTHTRLTTLLAARGIDGALVEEVQNCLAASEMGRYAPEGNGRYQPDHLLKHADQLVSKLEKAF